jgi:ABC-type microcin C transport system duplicated ATPase subunit YejF
MDTSILRSKVSSSRSRPALPWPSWARVVRGNLRWHDAWPEEPSAGEVLFEGKNLWRSSAAELFHIRRKIQLILQDTGTALNPRFTAEEIVAEPLVVQKIGTARERQEKTLRLMQEVGMAGSSAARRAPEFSGGQRQRLAIARAVILEPRLLIMDEALSGLDLSIQAQVLQLLRQLRAAHGLTYLLISHDLGVVGQMADEIAVLDRGRIVERGTTAKLFTEPSHPQTRALVAAIPRYPDISAPEDPI